VLFNTLAYAEFFAVVFIVFWLLTERRFALWLPWLLPLSVVVFRHGPLHVALPHLGIVLLAGALTFGLTRGHVNQGAPPTPKLALLSSLLNVCALAWVLPWDRNLAFLGLDALSALDGPAFPLAIGAVGRTVLSALAFGVSVAALTAFLVAKRVRLLFLVGASYVFYAYWDWRFLPLVFASSSIDYWLGAQIGRSDDPRSRKRWLWVTIALNMGVLATFKYLGFGVRAAADALGALGFHPDPVLLEIALPVGISFFTFESMSYVIDVYKRRIPPHPSYLEYLGFVAFFPHLVAGPIVRPASLLPQLAASRFDVSAASAGLFLIAWGLLKKVAIGDTLALNLVDRVFDGPTQFSSLECYAAIVGYAIQIYTDFSGYTDVAIGSSALLGIHLPLNFDSPYKAADIRDFWRRWHISLSSWLRDYLYIPLGGSRLGRGRTLVNLMVTMLLGGLWHGASYNFVIWGGLHGVALAAHQLWSRDRAPSASVVQRILGTFFTFHFVCAAWVFFRAETLAKAQVMFTQLAQLSTFHPNLPVKVVLVLAAGVVGHFLPDAWYERTKRTFVDAPFWAQGAALAGAAFVLQQMMSQEAVPFVYFQF
jgi:alginate O-acetyltransferase complex protein AlgI